MRSGSHPRQSVGFLLALTSTPHPLCPNSCRIRTSASPLAQPLRNPHFRTPLGSADSKRLTVASPHPQPLYHQHLPTHLGSAGNKGLITPLESALTKNVPVTPVESALTKISGEWLLWLTRFPIRESVLRSIATKDLSSHALKQVYPERPSGAEELSFFPTKASVLRSIATPLDSAPRGKDLSSFPASLVLPSQVAPV
jgi:hypothetical protein